MEHEVRGFSCHRPWLCTVGAISRYCTDRSEPAAGGSVARAFTLLELLFVIVIAGIVAAGAIPALSSMAGAREAAAARETQRLLALARTLATTAGDPAGVLIDPGSQTLTLRRLPFGQAAPMDAVDALGQPVRPLRIDISFPSIAIESFTAGDGSVVSSPATGAVWFNTRGEPELRDAAGAYVGPFSHDAVVVLTGGGVTVRRASGMVERW